MMDTDKDFTLRVPTAVHKPHVGSSHICFQGTVLGVGTDKVSHWTDDIMVAHNVIQGVTVLGAIVLIHPVSILQNHRFQADIISVWDTEFDSWEAKFNISIRRELEF